MTFNFWTFELTYSYQQVRLDMGSGLDSKVDVKGDGSVVLYKKHWLKNPKWIARLKVTGAKGYKTFSTKTTDQREAERIALDAYEEAYLRVKGGG